MPTGKRLYTADDMANGVRAISQLMYHVQNYVPAAAETMTGHCTNCKGMKEFTVAGSDVMKNGAVRKYGTCSEPGCNRTVSHFVSGMKEAVA